MERLLETFLFASRWLLAPFYVMLVLALACCFSRPDRKPGIFMTHALGSTEAEVILGVLALIDLTFTGSLIVIVIFSGYENFVSKFDPDGHEDWPEWMSKIDFSASS